MTDAAAIADLLAGLSARGETIDTLPEALRVGTEDDATAVQRAYLARHPSSGWKVGPHPKTGGWCAAPLRGAGALQSPTDLSAASARAMLIEVEVAIVLGRDLPAGCTAAEAKSAIGGTHLAFELFRSSYTDRARQDFSTLLADHLSNAGVVLGAGRPSPDIDLGSLRIDLRRDAEALASVDKGAPLDTILDAVSWLANYASSLDAPLKRGSVIITGARIGPIAAHQAGLYAASSALGDVAMRVAS